MNIDDMIQKAKEAAEKRRNTPGESLAFLQRANILDENGHYHPDYFSAETVELSRYKEIICIGDDVVRLDYQHDFKIYRVDAIEDSVYIISTYVKGDPIVETVKSITGYPYDIMVGYSYDCECFKVKREFIRKANAVEIKLGYKL